MEGNIVFFGCLCFTQHCKWGSVNGWLLPIFGLWLPIFIMSLSLWTVALQRIFFNCYHFLEILLNDLELAFLKFKHFYKIHRKSLFSFICLFLLVVSWSFYVLTRSIFSYFHTFPLHVNTHDEPALFWFVLWSLCILVLSTFCIFRSITSGTKKED